MSQLLANAQLILPDRLVPGWVRLEGGRLVSLGEGVAPHEPGRVDLGGDYLGPGLVDEHLHGALGRDFMESSDEAFSVILRHHAAGGTTALLPTSVAAPWEGTRAFLARVADWQRSPRAGLPTVLGAHVEGPFLHPDKAGAQPRAYLRAPEPALVDELIAQASTVRIVTLAPELPGALEAIDRFLAAGIAPSLGHSDAWDEEVQAAFARAAARVTHLYNAMSSARRRGPYRIAGLLEGALAHRQAVAELIADGHHVSATLLEQALRARLPDGLRLVSDATAGCGLPEGAEFHLGENACVVRGGVGLLADGSVLAGSTIRLIDGVRRLVQTHGVPLWQAWRMAGGDFGSAPSGRPADLVRLDAALTVKDVWLRGERL